MALQNGSLAGGTSTATVGWNALGVKTATDSSGPAAIDHNEYMADSHSAFVCDDCHAMKKADPVTGAQVPVSRQEICSSCHLFSKYTGLNMMRNVDHAAKNTGTECNKCHYSNSGVAANQGWRWPVAAVAKTRIPHSQWHSDVKGVCLDCHTAGNEPNYPANHYSASCETCHSYSNGSWKGAAGHTLASSNCISCHKAHAHTLTGTSVTAGTEFAGVDCSTCHQPSVTAGFKDWTGAVGTNFHSSITGACLNCHAVALVASYPAGHYTSSCETCHSYNKGSWKGAAGHTSASSNCISCHKAHAHTLTGTSVTAGTVFTGVDCSTCHQPSITAGFKDWTGAVGTNFHSSITGACLNCHTASSASGYPAGHYTASCESCHTYNKGSWKGAAGHTSVKTGCNSTGCHTLHSHTTVSSKTLATGQTFSSYGCELCHQASITNGYKDWLGATTHFSVSTGCKNCHQNHHNTSACESCHAKAVSGGYKKWST